MPMIWWWSLAWSAPQFVETPDGDWIALERHVADGPPVLLCHGISSNRHFWDLEDGRSLARYLQEAGFDVWNLDLRGHGAAERDPDGRRQRPTWTVDDYGTQDLPAAISTVRTTTGQAPHFVGHSMGGMVLAVYLATQDNHLRTGVVLGSPLDFRDPDLLVSTLLDGAPLARALGRLPTPMGARVLALTGRWMPGHLDQLLYNPDNIDPRAERRMLRTIVSPIHRGEVHQFSMARDGEFRSADGEIVYREALDQVTMPMLFIAGRADHVVSPDRVWSYYQSVGSEDRHFRIAGQVNGFTHDYGHLDLGCGDHVEREVFPWILDWLEVR